MLKSLGRHVTYANVVASLALFLATSGTAYAVATITGADVVDESLTGADIKGAAPANGNPAVAGTLTTYDLKDQSVRGVDLGPDTVTGPKINESTLDQVPSAEHASTAGFASTAGVAPPPTIEPWNYIGDPGKPVFEGGWVNYDATPSHYSATWAHASYAKDALGFVHLHGMVKGGTVGQVMFRLPGEYCPWYYHAFPVNSNNAFARLTVTWVTDQFNCQVYADTGSSEWISLDGIGWQVYTLENRTSSASGSSASPQPPASGPGAPPRLVVKR